MTGVRRRIGYVLAWLVAAGLAIAVGVAAVSTVGASIRDRGPLGNEVARDLGATPRLPGPAPETAMRRDVIAGDFGSFEVGCRGVVAYGIEATAEKATGWRVVSYEPAPTPMSTRCSSPAIVRSTSKCSATGANPQSPRSSMTP